MKQNACATTRESTFSQSINCFILITSPHAVLLLRAVRSSQQVVPSQVGVMKEGSRFYQGQGRIYLEHIKDIDCILNLSEYDILSLAYSSRSTALDHGLVMVDCAHLETWMLSMAKIGFFCASC